METATAMRTFENLTENAKRVLSERYLYKDADGNIMEDHEQLFHRVAKAIAKADPKETRVETEDKFYSIMRSLDFLPNTPTLVNAGRDIGQLSACFVLPVGDSMDEIFTAVKNTALIHKTGGGTGFSFSRLRSSGAHVASTGGMASGPISFMKAFDAATETVKQGGVRRGANMGILRVDHPDIMQFITVKNDLSILTNFNISVGITDVFMEAYRNGEEYELIDPHTKNVVGKLDAKMVYDTIVESAWKTGEPGIIFLDRMNKDNHLRPLYGEIESTNPCGEQPLLPFESCNLGSINLANHVTTDGGVWWNKLEDTVRTAVHFLDNVIEVNNYPLPEIKKMSRDTRKIGLGVMGWADMLLLLGIPYNSDEAIKLAGEVMRFINQTGHDESAKLASARGVYPAYTKMQEKYPNFQDYNLKEERNATVTTIAPTGSISIIAGVSSGVEPNFAYAYYRKILDGQKLVEANPILIKTLKIRGIYTDELMDKIIEQGTLAHIEEIPEDIRKVFVCSHDISPEYHVKMQAAFQKYTDNAVSKTVNFPKTATQEDVRKVYNLAYNTDCKGITIYRDGSRDTQVLNIGKVEEETPSEPVVRTDIMPRPRPEVLYGITRKVSIGCGTLYVTINWDENGICEVFTSNGKNGGCPSQSEGIARIISIALRAGVSLDELCDQLSGIRCQACLRNTNVKVLSCPDAIGRQLKIADKMRKEFSEEDAPAVTPVKCDTVPTPKANAAPVVDEDGRHCPECGATLESDGGCVICRSCGWSRCG